MPSLRPAAEPPSGYVEFVTRNLAPVREEATRLVGDEYVADRLYPDALSDVAFRWAWLEVQRRGLRRRDAAEDYLHRALTRRWQARQAAQAAQAGQAGQAVAAVDVGQGWLGWLGWQDDDDEPVDMFDIRVLTPGEPTWPVPGAPVRMSRRDPGAPGSAALRLATQIQTTERPAFAPVADAAIAWWHAYERWRRRRWAVVIVVGFLIVVAVARWQVQQV